ncbi:glycosyltransferase family 4 protein [Cellulomonas pakistanensis]|uniref:Glycosyl transferase family 1 n=1 Tax=Cellulomonas pakistanensis TaxID=992287 RepID=A0A919PCG9_9CELL|nr:glycosyltransferase family 1 protein [Cellulomonas pakistanensis]GIG36082.1 glycosyl transferase family 1 [Cellulomonas pakistanensis]
MTAAVHVGVTVEQSWQRVPGGSAAYTTELLEALRARDDVTLTGLAAAHRHPAPQEYRPPVPVRSMGLPRYPLYRAWNWLGAPRPEWAVRGLDVVHASTWAIPPTSRPLVVTVHDVAFLRDPAHFTPRGVSFFTRALERTRREAAAVVVPSRATADDCVAAGIEVDRVHVVPHGAPRWTVGPDDVAAFRARFGLPERFVLWCGTLEPRKNVGGLLAAFAELAARDPDVHLVLVGPPGWGELPTRPPAGPWESRVVSLGRLSAADLHAAYAAASAFCFPSTWEGFGLPVLEAMSVGTPVVTSRGTSMAEVVGAAGVLVDPADPADVADGLERALSSDGTTLGAAGRARSAQFRWADAAEQHAAVYRDAAR